MEEKMPNILNGRPVDRWTGGLVDWWTGGLVDWWTGGSLETARGECGNNSFQLWSYYYGAQTKYYVTLSGGKIH